MRIYERLNWSSAIRFLDYVLEKLPFKVELIQTDHGAEFGSQFHYLVLDRRIGHVYIKPATPRLNGKVERSHPIDPEATSCRYAADASTSNSSAAQRTERARQLDNALRVPPTLVERLEQLAGDPLRLCRLRLRLLCHPQAHGSDFPYGIKKKGPDLEAPALSSSSFLLLLLPSSGSLPSRAGDRDVVPREAGEVERVREARQRNGPAQQLLGPVAIRAGCLRLEVRGRRHGA
jgi:hypothetical protein